MPEYDGQMIIDVGIKTDGVDEGIKEVSQKVKSMTDAIKAQMSVIDKLKARYDAISKGIIKTSDESNLSKKLASENKNLSNLQTTLSELESTKRFLEKGVGIKSLDEKGLQNYEKLKNTIKTTSDEIKNTTLNIEKLKTSLASIKANPELSKEAINISKAIASANEKILSLQDKSIKKPKEPVALPTKEPVALPTKGIIDSVRNISQAISKSSAGIRNFFNDIVSGAGRAISTGLRPLSRAFSALTAPIRSIGDSISNLIKRGMRIGSFVFVFQILRRALYGVRDVFAMCAKSSGVFSNSLNVIKSNLLTAFYPIYQKIIPILSLFMKYLASATEYMARFVAMLFGKTLKQSQEGARQLYGTLQSFGNTGSGSGSIDDDTKAKNQNKSATDALERSEDKLLKKRRAGKAELFSFDKLIVLYTQNEEKLNKLKDKSKDNLGFSFVPTSNLAIGGEDIFSQYFKRFEKINESFKALSDSFKTKVGGFGKRLIEDLRNEYAAPLGDYITQSFIPRILNTTKDLIDGINWDRLNDSLKGLFKALEPFTENIGNGLISFYEKFLAPAATWTMNELIPNFINLVTESVKKFNGEFPGFKDSIDWTLTKFVKEPASAAGNWLVDKINAATGALKEYNKTATEEEKYNAGAERGDWLASLSIGAAASSTIGALAKGGSKVASWVKSIGGMSGILAALSSNTSTATLGIAGIGIEVAKVSKENITAARNVDKFIESLKDLSTEQLNAKLQDEEYAKLWEKLPYLHKVALDERIKGLNQSNEETEKALMSFKKTHGEKTDEINEETKEKIKKSLANISQVYANGYGEIEEKQETHKQKTETNTIDMNTSVKKLMEENVTTIKTKSKEWFGNFVKDVGKLAENTKEKFNTVGTTVVNGATTMWSEWSKTWNETILPKIKEKFGEAKTALINTWDEKIIPAFSKASEKIGEVFSSGIKWAVNKALGFAERSINWMIRRLNTVIGWIRNLPGLGWVGDIQEIQIPRLAQGAVLKGGNPFLAYVNDQPRGQTNIETPLNTMVQAFDMALKRNNVSNTPSNITIEASGDIDQIISMFRFKLKQEDQRIGNSFVTGDIWI